MWTERIAVSTRCNELRASVKRITTGTGSLRNARFLPIQLGPDAETVIR